MELTGVFFHVLFILNKYQSTLLFQNFSTYKNKHSLILGLCTYSRKQIEEEKKALYIGIPKLFFYVKSIHLRGSCRKVKKAVRRRMRAVGENE